MGGKGHISSRIDRDRKQYALRKKWDESVWRHVIDHPPSSTAGNNRLYLAHRSDGPCIYEYLGHSTNFWGTRKPNTRLKKLKYPDAKHKTRNYYKIGDKILHQEQDERTLYKLFPELARSKRKDATWSDFLWWFLREGEQDKYKYSWVIQFILPDGKGGGKIGMTGLIHFGTYDVKLETIHLRTREQLNTNFVDSSIDYTGIQVFAKVVITVSMIALQSVSKASTASAKLVAKDIIKKQLRKRTSRRFSKMIITAAGNKFVKNGAESSVEFLKVFAKELNKRHKEKEFYERIKGTPAPWQVLEPALRAALFAFVSKTVDGLFSSSIGEAFKDDKTMGQYKMEIAEALGKNIAKTHYNLIAGALYSAYEKAERENKPISMYLKQELHKYYKDSFMQVLTKDLVSTITG